MAERKWTFRASQMNDDVRIWLNTMSIDELNRIITYCQGLREQKNQQVLTGSTK